MEGRQTLPGDVRAWMTSSRSLACRARSSAMLPCPFPEQRVSAGEVATARRQKSGHRRVGDRVRRVGTRLGTSLGSGSETWSRVVSRHCRAIRTCAVTSGPWPRSATRRDVNEAGRYDSIDVRRSLHSRALPRWQRRGRRRKGSGPARLFCGDHVHGDAFQARMYDGGGGVTRCCRGAGVTRDRGGRVG